MATLVTKLKFGKTNSLGRNENYYPKYKGMPYIQFVL